jgi:hypothetical protein
MCIRLSARRRLEVHWLSDSTWHWLPRVSPFPPHWLYWGRFAVCVTRSCEIPAPPGGPLMVA